MAVTGEPTFVPATAPDLTPRASDGAGKPGASFTGVTATMTVAVLVKCPSEMRETKLSDPAKLLFGV